MKRPLAGGCLIFVLFLLFMHMFLGEAASVKKRLPENQVDENGRSGTVTGTVKEITEKEKQVYYILKKCTVRFEGQEKVYRISGILCKISKTGKSENVIAWGNKIRVAGRISLFPGATNPGGFDAKSYYQAKQLYYQCAVESFQVEDGRVNRCRQALFLCRKRLEKVYRDCLPEKEAGVVSAMLLGDKAGLDEKVKQLYQKNGLSHILAISGLHISMLGMMFSGMLKRMGIKEIPACFGSMAFIVCYGILTGFSVSTSRAVVMLLMAFFAKAAGRTYDRKTALAASAAFILLQRPYELFSAGFLLSFGAVLGIAYLSPVLERLCKAADKKKSRGSGRKQAETKLVSLLSGIREKGLEAVRHSISIQLATMPFLLWFYYELPPYSLVLNLFLLPLMSLLVLLAVLGGLAGIFCIRAGSFFLGGVYYILQFYELACAQTQRLPFSSVILGRPSVFQMVFYYGILFAFFLLGSVYQKRKALFLLAGLGFLFFPMPVKGLEVTFLDVGQGDGIVIRKADMVFMIDGGSSSEKELAGYDLAPYLKSQGIGRIDYALVTHTDTDHISGLQELLTEDYGIKIDTLLLSERAGKEDSAFMKAAGKGKCKIRYLKRGDCMRQGLLSLRCLHPDSAFITEDKNAASVTLSLAYGKTDMLFTGDLEMTGEEYLLKKEQEKTMLAERYDILKVGHHGSKYSTKEAFLDKVRPEISIISAGKQNRYGHPHAELLERLRERKIRIYQTKESGAVRICTDGEAISVREYTGKWKTAGKEKRKK